jgi:hypothetical protein
MKSRLYIKPTKYPTINRGSFPFLDIIYSELRVDVDPILNLINLFFCDFSDMTARWSDQTRASTTLKDGPGLNRDQQAYFVDLCQQIPRIPPILLFFVDDHCTAYQMSAWSCLSVVCIRGINTKMLGLSREGEKNDMLLKCTCLWWDSIRSNPHFIIILLETLRIQIR